MKPTSAAVTPAAAVTALLLLLLAATANAQQDSSPTMPRYWEDSYDGPWIQDLFSPSPVGQSYQEHEDESSEDRWEAAYLIESPSGDLDAGVGLGYEHGHGTSDRDLQPTAEHLDLGKIGVGDIPSSSWTLVSELQDLGRLPKPDGADDYAVYVEDLDWGVGFGYEFKQPEGDSEDAPITTRSVPLGRRLLTENASLFSAPGGTPDPAAVGKGEGGVSAEDQENLMDHWLDGEKNVWSHSADSYEAWKEEFHSLLHPLTGISEEEIETIGLLPHIRLP